MRNKSTYRIFSLFHNFSCLIHSCSHAFVCTLLVLRVVRGADGARCRILGASGSQDVPRQSSGETYKENPCFRRSREALPSPRPAPKTDFAARARCHCCGGLILLRLRISAIGTADYFFTCFRVASIYACHSKVVLILFVFFFRFLS